MAALLNRPDEPSFITVGAVVLLVFGGFITFFGMGRSMNKIADTLENIACPTCRAAHAEHAPGAEPSE